MLTPWRLTISLVTLGALAFAIASPATLGPADSERIWHMLGTMSLHGLPGMLAGLLANVAPCARPTVPPRRCPTKARRTLPTWKQKVEYSSFPATSGRHYQQPAIFNYARFGHNEGFHGTLSNRYALIRNKRWFRRMDDADRRRDDLRLDACVRA